MKDLSQMLLFFVAAVGAVGRASAQDSLSVRDASEIRYKAERMVKTELNELLNSLSNTGYETYEVAESIHASYAESRNRIFRDSLVLVEPDVNPGVVRTGQAGDEPLGKYLRDIDLLYKKNDSATIAFNNIRCSPVKKNDNIYVKVYFNSLFKGRSTISDQAYAMTNRMAEIKAEKDRNQWRLYIVRLAFFNPADTAGDVANNIPIRQQPFDGDQSDKITEQLQEQGGMDEERYKRMLALGDSAYQEKDLVVALQHFKDARELRPNSPEVYIRLKNTTAAMSQFKVDAGQLYAGFIEKAQLQEKNRQYKEAIENYQNAMRQKPEEATKLQPQIQELTERYAILSDLQEKYNAGLYKEALKEYTDAIRKFPKNSDYYLGRGRCHEKLTAEPKNIELALKDYSEAYELDHNNLLAIRYRGDLYAATGEYFKALSDYTVYLTTDRKNIGVYEQKAGIHVRLKEYPEALGDLDEALAVDPKAAHVYLTKGLLLMQYGSRHDLQKASENFTTSLQIDSSNALAYFHRGRCDLQLGRIPEAAVDFASAREKGLDTANRRFIADFATTYYNRAADQFTRKNLDSALHDIDAAIALEPGSAMYHFTKGEYSYALGDHKTAIASYNATLQRDPRYIEAWYKQGMAWYGLDEYKKAIDDFDAALTLNPKHLYTLKVKGDALRRQKDYTHAVQNYESALSIALNTRGVAPTLTAELYNALGYCYFQLNQYEKTVAHEKKAISEDRFLADAYFNRGYAYYRLGQLSEAIEDLTKAISLLDRSPDWHYVLGRAYLDKKDFGSALAQFGAYTQKDKGLSLPDAIYRQGYCNYMLQNYTGALPFYSRSLVLHLDTAASFPAELGIIYLNTGRYDSAYYYCQKAYQRDPTNGLASYGIGSSLALQGKADESIEWFERSFQKRTPSYPEIKRDRLLGENIRNNKKFKELLKKYF